MIDKSCDYDITIAFLLGREFRQTWKLFVEKSWMETWWKTLQSMRWTEEENWETNENILVP